MNATASAILMGLGGLSLFLYGMVLLSEGLKAAAGDRFRRAMAGIASRRWRGYGLGALMGTAVHSSATTVMVVGLLNAGLLTLPGAIPMIAGANLGTSLAMQLVAFNIGWLWSALALVGLLFRILPGGERQHRIGQAIIGMSLLFLGMQLMSQAVFPFRAELAAWMSGGHADSWPAFLAALGGSTLFTAVIQSSGSTIGILLALASAGVFTDIATVIPYIIGAQIGTCATAILASVGTGPEARRGALTHLYFNLFTAAAAIALLPWLEEAVRLLSGSLPRQIVHAHTLMLLGGGLLLVPVAGPFAALLRRTARFTGRTEEQSFLDETLMADPAGAVLAARRELVRAARIVRRGFALNRQLVARPDKRVYHLVKQSEATMDLIYSAMRDYLMRLSATVVDVRFAARIQWLNMSLIFLERISDHNDNLADLSMELNHRLDGADREYARHVCDELYRSAEPLLAALEAAWTPDTPHDNRSRALVLREHRSHYLPESERLQAEVVGRIGEGGLKPITGFVLTEYISELDRIVRHTKKIAGILEQSEPPPA